MSSDEPCPISHHLTDQAHKLKLLLELDDRRRRQNFIRNMAEKHNTSCEQPPYESVTASIEQRLQEQVNFYENALLRLKERSEEITKENKKLYETMNKSILQENCISTDEDEDKDEDEDEDEHLHFSRPKERLLRTKDEFKNSQKPRIVPLNDSDYSLDEPGQINIARNRAIFRERYGSDSIDFDASLASEPGQVPGYSQNSQKAVSGKMEEGTVNSAVQELHEINKNKLASASKEDGGFSKSFKPSNTVDCESNEMKKMHEYYESKNKHLESLLINSRTQVEQNLVEINNLKGELRMYKTPVKEDEIGLNKVQQELVNQSEKSLVQELLSEREQLFEAIKKQQSIVAESNRHETEAYYHVKRSCEMVEQVQLEKQESLVRSKQLESSLNEYQEKYKKQQKEHQDELSQVTKKAKQENEQIVEELNKQIDEQSVNLAVLQSHLEKSIREKADLKNELEKFERHTASQTSNTTAMIEDAQKEVMEALKKQTLAEHETGQIRLEVKMKEKRRQQEVEKLVCEVNELKRRLHVTEETLNTCQKQQLDMSQQYNSCKQQLQQEMSKRKILVTSFDAEKKRLKTEAEQREQELSQIIVETDKCYQLTKDELSKFIESQTHIVSKYQSECRELNEKVSAEKKLHQLNVAQIKEKYHQLEACYKEMVEKDIRKDELLEDYKQQIESTDHELTQKKEMVMLLMTKQSSILRERYLLSKEVEMLKSQIPSVLTE